MQKAKIILNLGSNLGEREFFIRAALEALAAEYGELKKSSLYETAAWGNENQGNFLNMSVAFEACVSPFELLDFCLKTEKSNGRERLKKWSERTLDMDIIYFGSDIVNCSFLQIPHPLAHLRRFVMTPTAEIAPEFIHPVLQISQVELLKICPDTAPVINFSKW
jgi:2-amino-4-hydroxy-6-hydroxymethyldihydropteridine diphosphokinase